MVIMEFGEEKHDKLSKIIKCIYEKLETLKDMIEEDEEYVGRRRDSEYRRGRYY